MTQQNPIRRVAVSVDTADTAESRVAWAASLTEAFGSHLTGLAAARPTIPSYAPFGAELAVSINPEIYKAATSQIEGLLRGAEAIFRRGCKGADGSWKTSCELFAADFLAREARSADLVVVGPGQGDETDDVLEVPAGDVVLSLGRPLIMVPPTAVQFSASRVVIAWKESREARRALLDAIPYLANAEEVAVCTIGGAASTSELSEIVTFLEAHAVVSKAVAEPKDGRSDTDALLGVVRRIDATLIVAGAYGQSRLKEWVFGGVTRDLLRHAPVPCLFSH